MHTTVSHRRLPSLVALALLVGSCKGNRAPASSDTSTKNAKGAASAGRYGYLVLPANAANLGLRPGDTLDEVHPTRALRALTDAQGYPTGARSRWGPFDKRCTRYFVSSQQYVVLQYQAVCSVDGRYYFDDPTVFMVFERDRTGSYRPLDKEVLQLQVNPEPAARDTYGRPIEVGQKAQPR